jgi:hypothetical protein
MALVTTTVSPEVRITPFTGLSETIRERSGIARAEVVYSARGNWPASGAGDNRSISFAFSLDPDYGYILMDANAAFIKSASSNRMEATGALEITTDLGPGADDIESQWYPFVNNPSRQDSSSGTTPIGDIGADEYNTLARITGNSTAMLFNLDPKPTALLYPWPGVSTIDVTAMFAEQPVQETIQAYRFYMRFLQYDIAQGYNYVVNSPLMTR